MLSNDTCKVCMCISEADPSAKKANPKGKAKAKAAAADHGN